MSKILKYQGRDVEVEEVEVITQSEPWNEYQLADGKILMVKTVLIEVSRAVTERINSEEPLYIITTTNHVKVR